MKIDVCIVTKNNSTPKGLEHIPINKIIVETSKPIGYARMKAIEKVTTPIFAFIDDDVKVSENWFKGLIKYMDDEKVGAVWGTIKNRGLLIFDRAYTDIISYGELKYSDRFNTNNSLIRTELVKDWIPSIGLNCYEDLDMGRHIMNKGYKILNIPMDTIHYKDFIGVAKSALWAGSYYYEAYQPNKNKLIKQYSRRILTPFIQLFTRGLLATFINGYRNIFFIIGMIKSDIKRNKKNVENKKN